LLPAGGLDLGAAQEAELAAQACMMKETPSQKRLTFVLLIS
jgi:hypothetical protein